MTEWAMKVVWSVAMFLTLSAAAQAKFAPVETPRQTPQLEDSSLFVGAAGAMLESDYFRAPQSPFSNTHPYACRLQLRVFEKTQLAQSCR
jgi:hypothetical protein